MNKLILLITLLVLSCGLSFDISNESDATVKKVELCNTIVSDLTPQEFKDGLFSIFNDFFNESFTKIVSEVKKKDTWPANEVVLKSLSLNQKNIPSEVKSSNSLGIIKSANIYIKYKDSEEKKLLASVSNTKINATVLKFTTEPINLVNYIDKGFDIEVDVDARSCPAENIDFTSSFVANVTL